MSRSVARGTLMVPTFGPPRESRFYRKYSSLLFSKNITLNALQFEFIRIHYARHNLGRRSRFVYICGRNVLS